MALAPPPPAPASAPRPSATPRGVAAPPDGAPAAPRRLRRFAAYGPRCPDCAGPLAFGEGCALCPICGYSRCGG